MSAPRVREILRADDPGLGRAHRLLRGVFPRAELLPVREWRYVLAERDARVWSDLTWHLLIAELDGRTVGAASGNYLGSLNVGIIGYVAVAPGARARGLGPRLRRRLAELFDVDARALGGRPLDALVGEVHATNPWLHHLVRREGAVALDFDYHQPALGHGTRAVPLVLYHQPVRRRRRAIPAAVVRRLIYALWRRAYRVPRPLRSAIFRRMLRDLAGRRLVGQRMLPAPSRARPAVE
ncbi:MAG TPA: GNAT family N-acetyltransferase [Gemmatimonadales bacterium]|nr:GNAT family N-acetyltransferase [Gemmatimonadales bacterium]